MLCLAVGLVSGGVLFSQSQPRSLLAIHHCRQCLDVKELAGLLAESVLDGGTDDTHAHSCIQPAERPCATADDREIFLKMNDALMGIFVADAGYVSQKLQNDFHIVGKRILFAQPRKNMKKLITEFQYHLYNTRMCIELNFRSLKMFYGLVTSLPRSINGYLANYLFAILSYIIA